MMDKYYLAQDNDSHWFVVPVAKQQEWDAWCDLDPDDEGSWEAPAFALAVGGAPCLVTFSNPEIA